MLVSWPKMSERILTIVNVVIVDESGINKREMAEHKQRLEEFVARKVADVGANLRIRRVVEAGQPYSSDRRSGGKRAN